MFVKVGDLVMTRYDRRWAIVTMTWWIGPPYKEQAMKLVYPDGKVDTQTMSHIVRISHEDR